MVGTSLAQYEILEKIGEGGMGDVYRARDTKLGREVAIKVLPESFARDAERLARFEREAKLLAALNHANIATLYGFEEEDGTRFLAMELVEGETLAERIARGAVPVDEALSLLRQIASALEAAHDKGIIHRDLKPANVKITPEGQIKVLDFGLAKAFTGDDGVDAGSSMSPTLTKGTALGAILGTAAYMSPEQAKGKAVDPRADIWAFGCVVFEALTGKRAFHGEDVSETLAAVLRDEPDWKALPASTPASLHRLLRRSLAKKPGERLAHIRDARLELDDTTSEPATPVRPRASRRIATLAGLIGLVAGSLVTGVAMWMATRPEPARTTRLVLENPTDVPLALETNHPDIAIAQDGSHIVFWTREEGQNRIYVRPLDAYAAVALEDLGTSPRGAFVSADSEWVGFFTGSALNKVALSGGATIEISSVRGRLRGASWYDDNTIVFATSDRTEGLLRVSASGGEPEILTRPDLDNGENNHVWPHFLPGGTHVLFTIDREGGGVETMDIAVFDLATRQQEILIRGGTYPRYAATGHIVYATSRGLEAVTFDPDRLEVTSEPLPLARDVVVKRLGAANFDVAGDGTLVYTTGGDAGGRRQMVWVDRQGRKEPLGVDPVAYNAARVSPDGRRIAAWSTADGDIWVFDVETESLSRLTFDASVIGRPLWTPDGERIVFYSIKDGRRTLNWKASDGSGQSERIADGMFPQSFTPDGRYAIALAVDSASIVLVPLEPDAEPEPLMERLHGERALSVSPDGKWLAFQSARTGRNEIYLRPFPNVDEGLWQISTETGVAPRWGPTSRELFYRRGNELIAATLDMNPAPRVLASTTLFETQSQPGQYDVAPDGERFLVLESVESTSDPVRIHVVLNWLDDLERQLPH